MKGLIEEKKSAFLNWKKKRDI